MVMTDCPACLTRDASMSVTDGVVRMLRCGSCGKRWDDPTLELAQDLTPETEY